MAGSDGLWAVAAVAVALLFARGSLGSADAEPVSTVLVQRAGQQLTLNAVRVTDVPADEGFWVSTDIGRVWVQIDTRRESPYGVDAGDVVNVSGRVVRHDAGFPGAVGVSAGEGAADLAGAGAHLRVPLNGVTFVR